MKDDTQATENPFPRRYNLNEAARLLGLSKGTVIHRIREGYLRATRLPGTFRFHITEDDLRAFIDAAEEVSGTLPTDQNETPTQEG